MIGLYDMKSAVAHMATAVTWTSYSLIPADVLTKISMLSLGIFHTRPMRNPFSVPFSKSLYVRFLPMQRSSATSGTVKISSYSLNMVMSLLSIYSSVRL